MFGNQSRQRLRALEREFQLRWDLGHLAFAAASPAPAGGTRHPVTLFHLAYCAATDEAGPEKPFDFSRATLADRWAAGSRDMAEAVRLAEAVPQRSGVVVHRISADRNDHL